MTSKAPRPLRLLASLHKPPKEVPRDSSARPDFVDVTFVARGCGAVKSDLAAVKRRPAHERRAGSRAWESHGAKMRLDRARGGADLLPLLDDEAGRQLHVEVRLAVCGGHV